MSHQVEMSQPANGAEGASARQPAAPLQTLVDNLEQRILENGRRGRHYSQASAFFLALAAIFSFGSYLDVCSYLPFTAGICSLIAFLFLFMHMDQEKKKSSHLMHQVIATSLNRQ